MDDKLSYPLDTAYITKKKKSLKKQFATDSLPQKNIAILGGSTTSEIKNILEVFLLQSGIVPNFYESEYNKYFEDAVFDNPELAAFNPDIIWICTSVVNITAFPSPNMDDTAITQLLESEVHKYRTIWESLQKYNCAIIQNNFDLPRHRSLGNYDAYSAFGKTHFIHQLNLEFSKAAREIKNLYLNDIHYLSSDIGLSKWFDPSLWYSYKYALSFDAIPHLAKNTAIIINAIFGKSKKCLILDLDNTCWGGVIGDDGLENICIGKETALAEAFTALQAYAKELKERGIMLAVCSKNDPENAKSGFTHPDSILQFEDFTSFKANWNPKNLNIVDIANEINIGLDSMVFIDDNPAEREIVRQNIHMVEVPDIGSDIELFIEHIDKNGYFEPVSISKDDLKRNAFYQTEKKRQAAQNTFINYEDFLKSLEMKAEILPFSDLYLDRITQLTNKTNQFNLTTKRYTFGEIESIAKNKSYITLYGKMEDKFGDNGLISVVIANTEGQSATIDLWLMSCRVLKRDMEYAMLDFLVEECKKRNIAKIIGNYYKTAKNSMVKELFQSFGFTKTSEQGENTVWELSISEYKSKQLHFTYVGQTK